MTENNHDARLAVLEAEMKIINSGHRDTWEALDKLRGCVVNVSKDIATTKLWMVTGVLFAVLPSAAFMFVKIMGW